jgi:small-conductance mechanosensitive channel
MVTIAQVFTQAERLFAEVSPYVNAVVIALVILLIGFILGKILESFLRYAFTKLKVDERLTRLFSNQRNYSRAIRRTIIRLIYLAAVLLALHRLSLATPALIAVIALIILVVMISLVLAGLDIVPNIVARGQLRARGIIVGDELIYTDHNGVVQGTVVEMTFFEVRVRRRNGDLLFIPNAAFLNQSVTKRRHA